MDDTFVVLHSDENEIFPRHINAFHPNIQFTRINISDNRLSFFGCLVAIDIDRTLSVTVPREKTTYMLLVFMSLIILKQPHR